jgi:hypothetical protein
MRSIKLDDMGYPLLLGSLGAPCVYVIYGFAVGGRSTTGGFDLAVAVVAFATAYGFSVVITGVFLLMTLLVAAYLALSHRMTWWLIAACPVVLGVAAGLAYAPFTGGMVFAMGFANALLLRLVSNSARADGGESPSDGAK